MSNCKSRILTATLWWIRVVCPIRLNSSIVSINVQILLLKAQVTGCNTISNNSKGTITNCTIVIITIVQFFIKYISVYVCGFNCIMYQSIYLDWSIYI